jgi:hypothetical protein
MLVIKQTTHLRWTCLYNLSVRQSALLLTVFTHLGYRPRLIIPVSAHIIADVYSASRLALPHTHYTKQKTPSLSIPGFLETWMLVLLTSGSPRTLEPAPHWHDHNKMMAMWAWMPYD